MLISASAASQIGDWQVYVGAKNPRRARSLLAEVLRDTPVVTAPAAA